MKVFTSYNLFFFMSEPRQSKASLTSERITYAHKALEGMKLYEHLKTTYRIALKKYILL